MKLIRLSIACVVLALTVGCAGHYLSTGLNNVQLGWSKSQFLQYFNGDGAVPPILRASQRQSSGQIVEVFTLPMQEPNYTSVSYWFVFQGDRLVQWGRPEDWQQVSGRYEIAFNPSASVN